MEAKTMVGMLVILSTLGMSGCGKIIDFFEEHCEGKGDGTADCRFGVAVQSMRSAPLTVGDLNNFDAAQAVADLSGSNVSMLSATSTGTVTLSVNGTVYASRTFTLTRNGTELRAAHPAEVNSWLRANAVDADSVALDIDGIRVGEVSGTNLFTMVVDYLGSEVAGTSYSWYRSPVHEPGYLQEK